MATCWPSAEGRPSSFATADLSRALCSSASAKATADRFRHTQPIAQHFGHSGVARRRGHENAAVNRPTPSFAHRALPFQGSRFDKGKQLLRRPHQLATATEWHARHREPIGAADDPAGLRRLGIIKSKADRTGLIECGTTSPPKRPVPRRAPVDGDAADAPRRSLQAVFSA